MPRASYIVFCDTCTEVGGGGEPGGDCDDNGKRAVEPDNNCKQINKPVFNQVEPGIFAYQVANAGCIINSGSMTTFVADVILSVRERDSNGDITKWAFVQK